MIGKLIILSFGALCLIVCSIYKVRIKPETLPLLLPLWIFSLCIAVTSFFVVSKKKYYDPYIYFASLMLVLQSYISWKNIKLSKVIETSMAEPSSVVFMCLLSRIFMKITITKLRILAIFIVSFGILLPILFNKNETNIDFMIVAGHILGHFIFCIINIIYEIKIKIKMTSIWSFLFTSTLCSFVLSSFVLVFEIMQKNICLSSIYKDLSVYIVILCEFYCIIFAFWLMYTFLPVERTFLKLCIGLAAALLEGRVLDNNLKVLDVFSFVVVIFGVTLYNIEYIRKKIKSMQEKMSTTNLTE